MNGPAIALKRVTKSFGSFEAVAGVDLEISRGELVAIMGSSGSGKTTVLRMIAGLETPTSGDIWINGAHANDLKPWDREVPMVWQNFVLFPHLSVSENVAYGLRMRRIGRKDRKERVKVMLETVGLDGFEDRSVLTLSGGQKQRVAMARALVLDPKILLLDEPLGALDAKIARSMQSELKRLHQKLGITFVYVTHNQSEAMALSDRIVVMSKGRIEQVGSPREIYQYPRNTFIAEFIGGKNIIRGQVKGLQGDQAEISSSYGNFTILRRSDRPIVAGEQVDFVVSAAIANVVDEKILGTPNEIKGVVAAIEMNGGVSSVFVRLADGFEFQVQEPTHILEGMDVVVGGACRVMWNPEDAVVLPRTEKQ